MIDEILATRAGGRSRIALRVEGRTVELIVEPADDAGGVGDIVLGRVVAVLKGMEAGFVDIGAERDGFLSLVGRAGDAGEGGTPVHEGARVLVQVTKAAQGDKGAGLTRNVTLAGRYLVLAPRQAGIHVSRRIEDEGARAALTEAIAGFADPEEGFIARTAAEGVEAALLAADADELRERWSEIEDAMGNAEPPAALYRECGGLAGALRDRGHDGIRRIACDSEAALVDARAFCAAHLPGLEARCELWQDDEALFEAFGIEDEIAAALEPEVALPCGGTFVIEETHALTAIDVNSGRHLGRVDHAHTIRAINLEAADEIARQLCLRNIGGLIVVDFIHMDDEDAEAEVLEVLLAGLGYDPAFIRTTGFTALGLVELARRRGRGALRDQLAGD